MAIPTQFLRRLWGAREYRSSDIAPDFGGMSVVRVPSVSHLERYQGAFTGAAIALEAASTGTASAQFPWATLQAIALAYDRAAYRHHRQLDFPADWSVPQWLLAETLWQTLDRPDLLGDGTVWLQEIMAAWRSLPWDALGYPDALREGFPQGEAAIALLKNRSIRSLWQRWLRQVSGKHHPDKHFTDKHFPDTYRRDNTEEKFPISEGPNAPLTSSDLWVSLGILSRSNGHLATAINQAKDLPPLTAPREAAILGWIGATIGLMNGPSPFTSTLAAAPDSVAIAYHQGTQCFCQWAGLPSPTVPTLTPWGISLPSSPPPVTLQ